MGLSSKLGRTDATEAPPSIKEDYQTSFGLYVCIWVKFSMAEITQMSDYPSALDSNVGTDLSYGYSHKEYDERYYLYESESLDRERYGGVF